MAVFLYKAKKNNADTVLGKINARSEDEAIELIHELGLLPVSIESPSAPEQGHAFGGNQRVKSKEIYVFSRQLSNLIKSGVSILRSLTIIGQQTQNPNFRAMLSHMAMEVKNGRSLSEVCSTYPKTFSTLYITMIRAGEESGNLREMLNNISEYQRREEELIRKVKTALAYPGLMLGLGMATVYFILTYVLPKMMGLFESLGDQLPLPTVILLNISYYLSTYWLLIITGAVCILFLFMQWRKTNSGKNRISYYLLHTPFLGKIVLHSELSRFCRSLSLLLNSGVSIVRSLEISIPILSNSVITKHLMRCKDALIGGGSFGETFKESRDVPPMMGHLIAVGEESGNLNDVLEEIADTYEQETNEQLKIITTLLEPILILFVGSIIGFMVFAILLPIFQIDILAQ